MTAEKVALITAGGSGMGAAAARKLAASASPAPTNLTMTSNASPTARWNAMAASMAG